MQRTLRNPIGCVGTGLHTGARVSVTLHPAEVNTGIRFMRYDRPGSPRLPARFDQVCDTTMCTTLGEPGGVMVATVEHLMASLAICEIDNVLVEVSGPELPIMDGSAEPFVFLIECAGVVEQEPSAPPDRGAEAGQRGIAHGKSARLEPADGFEVDCEIQFDHPLIDSQALRVSLLRRRLQDRDRARAHLRLRRADRGAVVARPGARRLAQERCRGQPGPRPERGGPALPGRVRAPQGARQHRRPVSRRRPLIGRFTGRCAGHTMHNKLLRALFADPTAWRMVDAPDPVVLDPPARRVAGA